MKKKQKDKILKATAEARDCDRQMTEDRLNNTISDIEYILHSLVLLREIQSTGDCNVCKNKDCGYRPGWGQIVRYNCPFYKAESEEE